MPPHPCRCRSPQGQPTTAAAGTDTSRRPRLRPKARAFLVKDINTQPAIFSSNPHNFFTIGSTTLFVAETPEIGSELWKTDGTAAGTALVKDINPFGGSSPSWLTAANGVLYFAVDDGAHGLELWKTDGTTAGTALVKDINPGAAGSNPSPLTEADGVLFFTVDDGTHGVELWKTDGTAAGTALVSDIKPGTEGSYPRALTKVNETLFFTVVSDPAHGPELWKSDGTAAGTMRVMNIAPEGQRTQGSDPGVLTDLNGTLFFNASTVSPARNSGPETGRRAAPASSRTSGPDNAGLLRNPSRP